MQTTRTNIKNTLEEILQEMIEMYELPPTEITDELLLIEQLGFSSVDIMHLLASVDMRFQKHLPYDKMVMKDGVYVSDLSVGQIVDFIHENFTNVPSEPKAMI